MKTYSIQLSTRITLINLISGIFRIHAKNPEIWKGDELYSFSYVHYFHVEKKAETRIIVFSPESGLYSNVTEKFAIETFIVDEV